MAKSVGIDVDRLFTLTSRWARACRARRRARHPVFGLTPNFAVLYLVLFLIVVAVGGLGSLKGTLVAALVLGVVDTGGKYMFPRRAASSSMRSRAMFSCSSRRVSMAASEIPTASAAARRARPSSWLHRHHFIWPEALPWLLAIAAFFLFPDRMTFGTQVLIMIMFALSLDLILGYAGIVTLGHAAFFGIGAYTVGLGSRGCGWGEPISGLFAAGVVAAFAGVIAGWFLLRYRGLTLLMLTLATAACCRSSAIFRSDFSGGYDGLPGLTFEPLLGLFEYDLYGHTNYIYVLVVLAWSSISCATSSIRRSARR